MSHIVVKKGGYILGGSHIVVEKRGIFWEGRVNYVSSAGNSFKMAPLVIAQKCIRALKTKK